MNTELTEMTALTEREQKLALMTAQATTQGMMQMLAPMLNGMQQMTQMMAQTVQQMCTMQESMASMHKAIEHSMPLTSTHAERSHQGEGGGGQRKICARRRGAA